MDAKLKEFIDLKQRGHTMIKYEQDFLRLSRYGGSLIDIEEKHMKRFRDGLDKELQKWITAGRNAAFTKIVNHAKELEEIDHITDDQKE